ncbi:hypothetical protein V1477_014983 [Vespula maculifrons]|uniref:Uncharacterized protein n=1 Tax=Vespula maculifrons TaxID=7453 RepID=A0ABD2BJ01_VESMC
MKYDVRVDLIRLFNKRSEGMKKTIPCSEIIASENSHVIHIYIYIIIYNTRARIYICTCIRVRVYICVITLNGSKRVAKRKKINKLNRKNNGTGNVTMYNDLEITCIINESTIKGQIIKLYMLFVTSCGHFVVHKMRPTIARKNKYMIEEKERRNNR